MFELVDEEAPAVARVIRFVSEKGKAHNYELTKMLHLSPSVVANAVRKLEDSSVINVYGEPQEGVGGRRFKRLIKMNPDMDVRIATQPILKPSRVIKFSVAWERRGPGSYYTKHFACYLKED